MTSSVTRRVVRTGGSCLVKRIVVLGDEPLELRELFAPGRLWLASDSSLRVAHKGTASRMLRLDFNVETPTGPFFFDL